MATACDLRGQREGARATAPEHGPLRRTAPKEHGARGTKHSGTHTGTGPHDRMTAQHGLPPDETTIDAPAADASRRCTDRKTPARRSSNPHRRSSAPGALRHASG